MLISGNLTVMENILLSPFTSSLAYEPIPVRGASCFMVQQQEIVYGTARWSQQITTNLRIMGFYTANNSHLNQWESTTSVCNVYEAQLCY